MAVGIEKIFKSQANIAKTSKNKEVYYSSCGARGHGLNSVKYSESFSLTFFEKLICILEVKNKYIWY